ncbi:MAG: hypothetical protein AMS22_07020 [Thiotrichales bacterium SG8_50]|jgi:uncharacterized protein (TIRG00374 family)|nr:MAG: hypothetical protein AMS22_07020 [Thiotrichales bacterium SG8_50]
MRSMKLWLIVTAKILATGALLYWLLAGTDFQNLERSISSTNAGAITAAVALHVLGFVLGGFRWWLVARDAGIDRPFGALFPSYYLGVFLNNFLPTGIGGDVVRIAHLKHRQVSLRKLVASSVGDRIIGLAVVLCTGVTALSFFPGIALTRSTRVLLITAVLVGICLFWLATRPTVGAYLDHLVVRFKSTKWRKAGLQTLQLLHRIPQRTGLVLAAAALSLIVQSCIISAYYILAISIDIWQPLLLYFFVIPVVFLAATLPISIGGLGVREGVFVTLLVAAGVDKAAALSLSLLYLAVLWLSSLPGALVLLGLAKHPPPALTPHE